MEAADGPLLAAVLEVIGEGEASGDHPWQAHRRRFDGCRSQRRVDEGRRGMLKRELILTKPWQRHLDHPNPQQRNVVVAQRSIVTARRDPLLEPSRTPERQRGVDRVAVFDKHSQDIRRQRVRHQVESVT